MVMTKDELKAALGKLVGESTDPEIIAQVDSIMEGYATDDVLNGLQTELEAERKRFKERFWGGRECEEEGSNGNHVPAVDYGTRTSEEIIDEFFKGV